MTEPPTRPARSAASQAASALLPAAIPWSAGPISSSSESIAAWNSRMALLSTRVWPSSSNSTGMRTTGL